MCQEKYGKCRAIKTSPCICFVFAIPYQKYLIIIFVSIVAQAYHKSGEAATIIHYSLA